MNKTPKTTAGRPRKPAQATRLPIFDSMAQTAAAAHVPLGLIRRAKRAGAAAFPGGGRVSLEPLLEWIFNQDPEASDGVDWGARLKEYLAKREKIKLIQDEKRSWPADQVKDAITCAVTAMFQGLDQLFDSLPSRLVGLHEVEISRILDDGKKRFNADLGQAFQQMIADERKSENQKDAQ